MSAVFPIPSQTFFPALLEPESGLTHNRSVLEAIRVPGLGFAGAVLSPGFWAVWTALWSVYVVGLVDHSFFSPSHSLLNYFTYFSIIY